MFSQPGLELVEEEPSFRFVEKLHIAENHVSLSQQDRACTRVRVILRENRRFV